MSVKPGVICYAKGDRCHGCAHYQGEASVCEYACRPRTEGNKMTTFSTLEVASAVTGIGLCQTSYARMKEIMSHVVGYDLWTHELVHKPTADNACAAILALFPDLPTRAEAQADWKDAAAKAVAAYGETVTIPKGASARLKYPLATLIEAKEGPSP